MKPMHYLAIATGLALGTSAAAQTAPRPTGDIAQYLGADNYPPAALRVSAQGRTVARLVIAPTGLVSDCQIAESSGNQDLDMQTCRMATQRLRFEPARDAKKRPVESVYRLPVRWSLPNPIVPVMPAPTTAAPAGG